MPSIVSLYGEVAFQLQDKLRSSLRDVKGSAVVGNFVSVELPIDRVRDEWGIPGDSGGTHPESSSTEENGSSRDITAERLSDFRTRLDAHAQEHIDAHEWSLERPFTIHVRIESSIEEPRITVEHRTALYRVEINDDSGTRVVPIDDPRMIAGRAHDNPPRAFVPVHDASRTLSREHLQFAFENFELVVRQIGQNETLLNGVEMNPSVTYRLRTGDRITCGPYSIIIASILPDSE